MYQYLPPRGKRWIRLWSTWALRLRRWKTTGSQCVRGGREAATSGCYRTARTCSGSIGTSFSE
jgi:hypothetical protein